MQDILTPNTNPGDIHVTPASYKKENSHYTEIYNPTRGQIKPLVDGIETFKEIYQKFQSAEESILITIWYIQTGDDEAILGDPKSPIKIIDLLKRLGKGEHANKRKIKIRVLLNVLSPILFPKIVEAEHVKNKLVDENIKVLVDKHPHKLVLPSTNETKQEIVLGSFHEKLVIVDSKYVFCGGIEFEAANSVSDQDHIKKWKSKRAKDPEPSRHDIHSLIQGPIVSHFEQHFRIRWLEAGGNEKDISFLTNAGLQSNLDQHSTNQALQLVITKSTDDTKYIFGKPLIGYKNIQQDVYKSYLAAIKEARYYVYIENQYFRSKELADALVEQLKNKEKLQVIIVLPVSVEEKPENEIGRAIVNHADYVQNESLEHLLKSNYASRIGIYSLRRKPSKKFDIFVHSKIMIIDDKWVTIGSANTNPRSFFLDTETNVIVRDNIFSNQFRLNLWTEHLQERDNDKLGIRNFANFVTVWDKKASENETFEKKGISKMTSRVIRHHLVPGQKLEKNRFADLINKAYPGTNALGFVLPDPDRYV